MVENRTIEQTSVRDPAVCCENDAQAGLEKKSLPESYRDWVSNSIGETGVGLNYGMTVDADGALTFYALDLTPTQAYAMMLTEWTTRRPSEMIFALDRFAKPGQGTALGDLVAGFFFPSQAERPRPFIIEYRHEPRLVEPLRWDNPFWTAALNSELLGSLRNHFGMGPLR